MKKICFVFGTRPEAIKLAPVIIRAKRDPAIAASVVVTGQHKQMLNQVLSLFDIEPDLNLNIMSAAQSLSEITSRILAGLDQAWGLEQPDCIVVHGDTATTFAASLAGFYRRIPICHVEAGLRTFDKSSPWPEEVNRKLTAVVADLHFAPTTIAEQNLIGEGISKDAIHVTGNTVVDALLLTVERMEKDKSLLDSIRCKFDFLDETKELILVTGHRRENFGTGFENICSALAEIALKNAQVQIVYAVHLNPNVQQPVQKYLGSIDNINLIEPQDYYSFIYLMKKSHFILTDSGGIQEEAPSLGKPVLVMRDTTERPEGVQAGTVKLVGAEKTRILNGVTTLLHDQSLYVQMSEAKNPYGDGEASQRILTAIKNYKQ
ncbi:UDP-N-acetylglucosamine 2-epimerase (non-hydrolyzing) [Luminiphilus sp.]|nr:UDP-N-acetylglucosamine 2-epimerase (non-hydrolyzing) [Luminiphilus sp.]